MSDPWPMIAGVGAGIAAAAAVGQMIIGAVSLGQQNSNEAATNAELAELTQRLRKLEQILREHGYLNDGGASTESIQAKLQAEQVHTIDDLKRMERSLEQRVAAITAGSLHQDAQKSRFTKMMEERGRRFL